MYEPKELPDQPTLEQIGEAIDVLICAAMHNGGEISGMVERIPLPDAPVQVMRSFHFSIHDTRVCEDHAVGSMQFGTLQ